MSLNRSTRLEKPPGSAEVIAFPAEGREDAYLAGHRWLRRRLLRYVLVDSLEKFQDDGKPYPFVERGRVLPHQMLSGPEAPQQNAALVVFVDGTLPSGLNRHFRLRVSNQVGWQNLRRMAPMLDLGGYRTAHNRLDGAESEALLRKLLPLDYALLVERPGLLDGLASSPATLTHLHMKVERLTDNAIRDLGRRLGYIRRSLFERGEDYADALEGKFFEYFGFPAVASGRKSAAAMAAQLLQETGIRYSVFVAGQQDGRLSILSEGERVRHAMLIAPSPDELPEPESADATVLDGYALETQGRRAWLYEVDFARTSAGSPEQSGRRDLDLQEPWLAIAAERVLGPPGRGLPPLPVRWSGRN